MSAFNALTNAVRLMNLDLWRHRYYETIMLGEERTWNNPGLQEALLLRTEVITGKQTTWATMKRALEVVCDERGVVYSGHAERMGVG